MSVQSLIADLLPVSPSSPPMAKAASHVPPAKPANLAKTRVVAESAPVANAAKPWLKMAKTPSAPPGEDPVLATFSHASPDFSQAESRAVTGGLATLAALAGDGCANDAPDRHHTWLVTLPDGERFSSMFCPPLSLAEVEARYPNALVEREPDPAPAPPLSPDALEIAYAYLRHIGEQDLEAGQQFIEAVARDPEQLRGLYADVVKMGIADWPDDQATEPDTDTDTGTKAKAICSRCRHWTPDRINPAGGLGRCTIDAPASKRIGALWPGDGVIHCAQYQEARQ